MLRQLRSSTGSPGVRTRLLALLVVLGLLLLTAPIVLIPLIRGLLGAL
ncbi:MAG TPA: hypothetical protein VNG13_09695 [Mycobacteriales bacterium]|nr:hypothetical protein [Mycobacteriales bacterium]